MIFTSDLLSAKARTQVRAFLNIRPIPQLPVWENFARNLIQQGFQTEAAILLDLTAQHYDRSLARDCSDKILPIPVWRRGRPVTNEKNSCSPVPFRDGIILATRRNILFSRPDSPELLTIPIPDDSAGISSIIGLDSFAIFIDASPRLYCVNLDENTDNPTFFYHDFPNNIRRLCGCTKDGTFFVTCEPLIPVFSDTCMLCQIDLDKIRDFSQTHAHTGCEISEIQAIPKILELKQTQQTLLGDTCVSEDFFMTCGGGMQNQEVRFIHTDGSWSTKCVHEFPVIRVIPTDEGIASLDTSGRVFLWSGKKIVDDGEFPIFLLPEKYDIKDPSLEFSLDWIHRRLYLTQKSSNLSCCLTPTELRENSFIGKHLPVHPELSLVMLSDKNYYYWSVKSDSVAPLWQLPSTLADAADWKSILSTERSPSVEEDPRIRLLPEKL